MFDVPDDIRHAAQHAFTTMAQYYVVSTLPLRMLLSDISDGGIPPRCARRMHTVEALLHLHHLNAGADDESPRRHATSEIHTYAGPYSHRIPTSRFHNPVPVVPPSVRSVWPVIAQNNLAISTPDSSRLET